MNTLESILACTLVPALILALLVGAFLIHLMRKRMGQFDSDRAIARGLIITLVVCAVLSAAGLWWGMYPWKAEYHQWRPVSGVVQTVDKRLVSTGDKSMEDKFVVTFQGNPQQYGVLDTRAAGVKPGDLLSITCVKRWQWSGSHGFDCNFVDMTSGGAK